jgi:transposase InsO family protein
MPRIEKFDRQRADLGPVLSRVVLDGFSRVSSWRVSITMEAAFRVETLADALARYGKPNVYNTDQGWQFRGHAFTGALASNGITISMTAKATSSSSGCGAALNTRSCVFEPTTASATA